GTTDLELRMRVERLLKLRGGPNLQHHRAVMALELRNTPGTRRLLARLADGLAGAHLTEEAEAALARLRTRGPQASREGSHEAAGRVLLLLPGRAARGTGRAAAG